MITTGPIPAIMRSAAVAGLVLAAACGPGSGMAIEASGTVEATEADLGFAAGGIVDSMFVLEGDRVAADRRLAVLDRRDLRARLAAATAQVNAQRARLSELERGFREEEIAQGRLALSSAEHRVTDAQRDERRASNLLAGGVLSQEAYDRAATVLRQATTDRDQARERLQLLEAGPRPEQIAAQRAQVAQAEAMVGQVESALAYAEIRAPFPGIISRRHREPGEVVGAGLPVVTIQNLDDRWVRIYLPGDQVGRVRLGGEARIVADAFPDREYVGQVVYIADEAEYTPRTVQTKAERVTLVYRVKVRVTGDSAQDLKIGVPADVRIP